MRLLALAGLLAIAGCAGVSRPLPEPGDVVRVVHTQDGRSVIVSCNHGDCVVIL